MPLSVGEIKQRLADADALHREGLEAGAIDLYKSVLPFQSDNATVYAALGECYINLRETEAGIPYLKRALDLDKTLVACHLRLADAYNIAGRRVTALKWLEKCQGAMTTDELRGWWHGARADIYKMDRNYASAEAEYKKAMAYLGDDLQFPHMMASYAGFLTLIGRFGEATKYYEDAYMLCPNYLVGQNLAMHYLTLGMWDPGWRLWEIRLYESKAVAWTRKPHVSLSDRIDGPLVFCQEGGLGDFTMMVRYIPLFKDVSPRIIIAVDPRIEAVAKAFELPGIEVMAAAEVPEHEAEMPMFSIPFRSGLWTPEQAPPPARLNLIPHRVSGDKPQFLINWFGDSVFTHDDLRSAHLRDFAKIVNGLDVHWVAVNRGPRVEREVRSTGLKVDIRQGSLLEACEVIAGCDAVVTTDTGLAHIAGTLGKPTFLVCRQYATWHFGVSADRGLWYPSIRVYRWRLEDDRDEVMEEVLSDLRAFLVSGAMLT